MATRKGAHFLSAALFAVLIARQLRGLVIAQTVAMIPISRDEDTGNGPINGHFLFDAPKAKPTTKNVTTTGTVATASAANETSPSSSKLLSSITETETENKAISASANEKPAPSSDVFVLSLNSIETNSTNSANTTNTTNTSTSYDTASNATAATLPVLPTKRKSAATKCVERRTQKWRNKAQNSTDGNKRKPILYLHPGPPKTATTTIQQLLTDHQSSLEEDGIFYLGKKMPAETWHCRFDHAAHCPMYKRYAEAANQVNPTCLERMKLQLDAYYQAGVDVILSDEVIGIMFSGIERKHRERAAGGIRDFFGSVVRTNDWEVRVLVGYRPYFDFVASQFSQVYKRRAKPELAKWPRAGGIRVPPLGEIWNRNIWPNAVTLVELFRTHADRVDVVDITTKTPSSLPNPSAPREGVAVRFFCDLLRNAKGACEAERIKAESHRMEVRRNKAVSHDYDQIATAAADGGFLNHTIKKLKRATVANQIWKFVRQHGNNGNTTKPPRDGLPLVCPSGANNTIGGVDELYYQSLEQEMVLFPERNPNWETDVLYKKFVEKRTLCTLDTNALFQREHWVDFFASLEARYAPK